MVSRSPQDDDANANPGQEGHVGSRQCLVVSIVGENGEEHRIGAKNQEPDEDSDGRSQMFLGSKSQKGNDKGPSDQRPDLREIGQAIREAQVKVIER
jgi:hypothetical protein